MGIHDRMAQGEWFKGRDPQRFHAAAQKHANALYEKTGRKPSE